MPSLKDLRNRITSVKATQKITKAMQMVAAAKLRRAQNAAENGRPYAERMAQVLGNLAGNLIGGVGAPRLLSGTGQDRVHLLVVCTGDRGLAGAFNSSIARLARDHANRLMADGKTVKIMTIGKKGLDVLRRQFRDQIIASRDIRGNKPVDYPFAAEIADDILARFEAGEFDVATLFYSEFRSVISQIPTAQKLIPAELPTAEGAAATGAGSDAAMEFEPNEETILETLLPKNLTVQIFRALLENAASEQGARMSAMDSATRNAGEMIKKQTLIYNRTRQAMITKELIEIISGAEAL
ncbi:MAG: F0F1 ATP synthase subunit gamma [Methylobacteriaceae bacterium]|jgi:F-type H+-transporting ATPase subunit gamma|uniref:ATP synthase gamma chain n=1 Tax=Methylorubrum extorquens TaxID=408 RepID=A0A2N9AUX8_METEX|nr:MULTISPECIES: F0F1 ATP synthase subunit gamma [Methylobacteriaceae]KQO85078.1 ATP synthase F0F1 subunit gamma [Methylobacterium sp. Leaf90]KQO87763.1 ATP synthase F0F1 subunit gamma [Methylobacterium sp. Leaf92]KQP97322.1 ATP synthase F0F1 subunit gamma [Methylobacterium sp. Leaf121]MDF9866270.1 F-type H+-transporting ATPase subunit gamma [Methylorubrum pseudosasae]MDH6639811.1 F-type H+-transporting ATPase subunit gamma [Methylobacterium sp. SuP10 SLI 274]